jgi:hypothetical protein
MDSAPRPEPRVLWLFWVASGLAATGALAPLLLTPGDISYRLGVAIPFAVAAVAMAAIGVAYPRGRSVATALYILAWIAIVYGILRMIAVPLQQAVVGACSGSGSECGPGLARPFGGGEGVAIGVGIITGALSLQLAFLGLRALFRRPRKQKDAAGFANPPPTRILAPVKSTLTPAPVEEMPVAASAAIATEPTSEPAPVAPPVRKPRTRRKAKPAVEPVAPEGQAELPAHTEPAELPAHSDPAELPPHSSAASSD